MATAAGGWTASAPGDGTRALGDRPGAPSGPLAIGGVGWTRRRKFLFLGPASEPGKDEAIIKFAAWFVGTFHMMLQTALVTNVQGTGPVPSFAPPYIPVGPVVGGLANSPPGFLLGGP